MADGIATNVIPMPSLIRAISRAVDLNHTVVSVVRPASNTAGAPNLRKASVFKGSKRLAKKSPIY